MDQLEAQMMGTWLMEAVEGDVTEWLKLEGVGWKERQVMWMAGYGKGRINLSLVIKEGTVYNLTAMDDFAKFRFQFKLDGQRHAMLFTEGAPFMPFRNFSVQGKMTDEGAIEATMFNDKDDIHSKSSRSVGEDGATLKTDITFLGSPGKEIRISMTHKRVEAATLRADDCTSWCPNVLIGDASAEAGREKKSAVSAPLEALFSGVPDLMECIEHGKRKIEETSGGDKLSLIEISSNEFNVNVTKAGGAEEVFEHKLDKEAGTLLIVFKKGDQEVGSWHLKALQEPLRAECWCTLDDNYVSTVCALTELQNSLDKAFKHKRGQ
mmetsp:Transcript_104348/g.300114  ORF Transcript_104348/g.300114 Transcript_104348/m.300114 type:complete len:322 (+) Transcript_104348:96-1061(+)|eukprot:CAMPEP_0177158790 /NCGR_PEP_ID=MMETSP0367-20130122/3976_1 /TAXON_ID=447022 ORGANISM="Scrippsiella hangoei-like, Strain SHHI-4" /NCGR_SAMPLE_ID=MMETSP0367 /ASSEMBLY_ACC=CAM_ASM_000362 /LENGTH=321 /DNA_ID=CAMNT_0018604391 /DNA_START=86 /DNA_END=1051 /DNA_ORIENTATION=-